MENLSPDCPVPASLTAALGLEPRENIALVGAGGKTALMFTLAEELCRKKRQVLTSTTTKIWHHEAQRSPFILLIKNHLSWREMIQEGLKTHGHIFLGQELLTSGKVKGIDCSVADELYQESQLDYVIVEADGSSGLPVKAPSDFEPVIPPSTTLVVALLGLESLGKPCEPTVVFRMEPFKRLTGIAPGEKLTPQGLSKLFLDLRGLFKGTPVSSRRVVFLNKSDLVEEGQDAGDLARLITRNSREQIDRVIIGSLKTNRYLLT